jgi:hypothetical protein
VGDLEKESERAVAASEARHIWPEVEAKHGILEFAGCAAESMIQRIKLSAIAATMCQDIGLAVVDGEFEGGSAIAATTVSVRGVAQGLSSVRRRIGHESPLPHVPDVTRVL